MKIPEQDGTYWYKGPNGNSHMVDVAGDYIHIAGKPWNHEAFNTFFGGGTWGNRIPTDDEITAMRDAIDAGDKLRSVVCSLIMSANNIDTDRYNAIRAKVPAWRPDSPLRPDWTKIDLSGERDAADVISERRDEDDDDE